MGLLKNLFGKETNQNIKREEGQNNNQSQIMMVDLSESKQNLDKVLVNLSKTSKVDLTKHTAMVALVMDYSGSMRTLFNNGSVQKTITRLLPIALKFDDNGELESWLFSDGYKMLDSVDVNNYKDYVGNIMTKSGMDMGGTRYAPVLNDVVKYYKNKNTPAFIIFITDGENFDKSETDKIVKELSEYNMFVQFVGIGNAFFNYLRSLDNMPGRKHDNTGFIAVSDMNKMTDEELYTELLRQYKEWLNNK